MKTIKILFMSGILAVLTMLGSCADDNLGRNEQQGNLGTAVSFNVSDAQGEAIQAASAKAAAGMPLTRTSFADGLALQDLTPEDLTLQKLAVNGTDAEGLCLIESTVAGVNPVKQNGSQTRANITVLTALGKFSTIGYRGVTAGTISTTPWFYSKETNPNGTLVSPIFWAYAQPFARFFAIYPKVTPGYTKLALSPEGHTATPYVDFEVESNVKNQKDLMTACSGLVEYQTQGVAPTTNLKFRHAMTAVRFKVGQNLSWNKTITKVEIVGAKSKGRYTLSPDETGAGAAWSTLSDPKTFTLGGDGTVNVSTSEAVNNIIMGKNNDNYTFYMIPQSLSGVQVKIYFNNSPTPAITANLSGTWKAGTTKTYALSQNTSNWQYELTVASPAPAAYNAATTGNYTIQSYRQVAGRQEPVKWKVIGYDKDNNGTFSMSEKPDWLTSLSTMEGDGGTAGETGTATLTTDVVDKLAARNSALKNATPLGGAGSYYDLSTKGGSAARNTANSYVISAPGFYKIPLVYGNAITNAAKNEHAYISQAPTGTPNEIYILRNFKDHAGVNITDPWITKSNGGANIPNGAKLVWADESGLVTDLSLTGSGENAFVTFKVPENSIKTGNAVIAVTKNNVVVWSWHLWFTEASVLDAIACTNSSNETYGFSKETLGWKYTKWLATTYSKPRSVKVKVEQELGQGAGKKVAVITIVQNHYRDAQGYSTHYQWGRKEPMPGIEVVPEGAFSRLGGDHYSVVNAIQHPEMFYSGKNSFDSNSKTNLWSMDFYEYAHYSFNKTTVKTVYDPCPAGFCVPIAYALNYFTSARINGVWNYGWDFNNKVTNPDDVIYFPPAGCRGDGTSAGTNALQLQHGYGIYWTSNSFKGENVNSCNMVFSAAYINNPYNNYLVFTGCAVRPMKE